MRKERTPQPLPEPDVLAHILEQVKVFLLKNGLHLAVVIGVVLVGFVAYRTYTLRHTTQSLSQWETIGDLSETSFLFMYQPAEAADLRQSAIRQCRQIIENQPETSATPWLLLKLANLLVSGEEWSEAAQIYKRLTAEYGNEIAATWAPQGLAVALEGMGQYDEAAAIHEKLGADGRPAHLLHAGRCRELAGDVEGATHAYRKVLDPDVPEDLRQVAAARLAELAAGKLLSAPPELKRLEAALAPTSEPMTVPAETGSGAQPEGETEQEAQQPEKG